MFKNIDEWRELADAVLPFFPGYQVTGFDPDIELTRWEHHRNGKSTAVDHVRLSVMAVICLTTKIEPARVLREDLYDYDE